MKNVTQLLGNVFQDGFCDYCIYPKYLDGQDWANSEDPDQMPQEDVCVCVIRGYTPCHWSSSFYTSACSEMDLFKYQDKYGKGVKLSKYFTTLGRFSRWWIDDFFLIFPRKEVLTFHANCFLGKNKNILKCLLKILPSRLCLTQTRKLFTVVTLNDKTVLTMQILKFEQGWVTNSVDLIKCCILWHLIYV